MLDRNGVSVNEENCHCINICAECRSALTRKCMPKFALSNKLYRGSLPDQFQDLTWVEEMMCSIYRNTAHIVRLFGSSDLQQPKVLHGNTCAHEMNVISTASVLPRTPADINGMLSVVFIGREKFDPKKLVDLFRVRKVKVWTFLLWLKDHNQLYMQSNIMLDETIMALYPDDDILPGLADLFQYLLRENGCVGP
ncbi:hypothetical protein NEOLEDRAFT_1209567 [Neolentinus lepideus HHB14362 ss-1]|uniref:DUF6570 domain-containing protein n=1 Tax=Neolentinus lepideus HHB14362 ss-1 TaxID=1314782 RepID=A0A165VLI9_9AGAM|nr:hypothetical protein NEOLEDRAFT_1209567 [Neolentinus lepideus HHB14362 ss-1]